LRQRDVVIIFDKVGGDSMNKSLLLDELMQLDPADRLDIADQLWDSVHPPGSARPGDIVVLTQEQMAELDRRLEENGRHPERAQPWEVVRERIWSRFDK
jgi:putative addiction module component (TIGR02574 family)